MLRDRDASHCSQYTHPQHSVLRKSVQAVSLQTPGAGNCCYLQKLRTEVKCRTRKLPEDPRDAPQDTRDAPQDKARLTRHKKQHTHILQNSRKKDWCMKNT
jgi:hypothetical protein